MKRMELYLSAELQLIETMFRYPIQLGERRCVRGKSAGAYRSYGSFQWTKAVQGLTILFVQSALSFRAGVKGGPDLVGGKGSYAASLDDAISKETGWLYEMFGGDQNGELYIKRIVLRTNSGRKRTGPVALAVNSSFLNPAEIKIFREGAEILSIAELIRINGTLRGECLSLAA